MEQLSPWLRLLTPILVALCLFILQQQNGNLVKIGDKLDDYIERLVRVETKLENLNKNTR